MLRAPKTLLLVLCSITALACKGKDEELSTEPLELIPAALHGTYGRTPQDAPGMTVSGTGLEFDEMELTIHAGKMEGDTVRIERATLKWEKLEPKTCTGTIARQGGRLLLDLYEVGGQQGKCDSMLDAEWFYWEALTELPAMLHGRYDTNSDMVFSVSADRLRIDVGWLQAEIKPTSIRQLPGSNDERAYVLIDESKVSYETEDGKLESICAGTIELADGRLSTEFWLPRRFEPDPGSPEASDPAAQTLLAQQREDCEAWIGRAQKFEVSMDGLPKAPIKKGEVSLSITPETVVLDSPALRCEQELWGTENVPSGYGVFSGQRMTLGKAEPSAVSDGCKLNLRIWCERELGNDKVDAKTPPSDDVAVCMKERERELCPASIIVQAISDLRYKFAVEPFSFNEIACVDTTGDFTVQK